MREGRGRQILPIRREVVCVGKVLNPGDHLCRSKVLAIALSENESETTEDNRER
jgi:hypothetical protein